MPEAIPSMRGFERRWKRARIALYAGLAVYFSLIAFHFGPRYILFRQLTWITPDYFAESARKNVEPIVRAIKQYEADYGMLPSWQASFETTLVPAYLPQRAPHQSYGATTLGEGGIVYHWGKWNHSINYDLNPESEGWSVYGPFVRGKINLPLVKLNPNDRTRVQPTSQANGDDAARDVRAP